MNKFLMSVETVKIKDFIFSTNKLKLIRGASYLLDYLNQKEVPEILERYDIKDKEIIYVGAGNAKFFVDSKEKAENIAKDIKRIYKVKAPNAKIAIVYREIDNKAGEKVWDSLDRLAEEIAIEKSKGFSILNIDLPFVKKCPLCEKNPAVVSIENLRADLEKLKIIGDKNPTEEIYREEVEIGQLKEQIEKLTSGNGYICEECLKKLIYSNNIKIKDSEVKNERARDIGFYQMVDREFSKLKFDGKKINLDFEKKIDDYAGEKSFIGFMYSDGDGLGDFLKNISKKYKNKSEEDYLKFMGEFSKKLDKNTKEALLEVLIEKKDLLLKGKKNSVGEFLIVGGDDVCAIFNSKYVLEISKEFQKKFEEKMEKYTTAKGIDNRITSSSGVVLAKAKVPAYHLFDQALTLQKSAKAKRHKANFPKTGYIDFQVIGSEGCVDIKTFRKKISPKEDREKNIKENKTIERPYSIVKEEGTKEFQSLIDIIKKLKKNNFPKTKLRYLYDLKRNENLEEFEKKMEFINILSKMSAEQIETIKKIDKKIESNYTNYNEFNSYFENIFDILEIYDFVGGED